MWHNTTREPPVRKWELADRWGQHLYLMYKRAHRILFTASSHARNFSSSFSTYGRVGAPNACSINVFNCDSELSPIHDV